MRLYGHRNGGLAAILLIPLAAACASGRSMPETPPDGTAAVAAVTNEDRVLATSAHPVAHLATATEAAFRQLGITLTERETDDDGLELEGTQEGWKIEVDLEREDGATETSIEISVTRDGVTFDRARAQRILSAIIAHANAHH